MTNISSPGPSFKGAVVEITATETIPNSSTTPIPWDAAILDTNVFWAVGNPTRLTVPAGVSRVRLSAKFSWNSGAPATTEWFSTHRKSGGADISDESTRINVVTGTQLRGFVVSQIIPVTPGDYFTLDVFQSAGATRDLNANANSFAIEVLG